MRHDELLCLGIADLGRRYDCLYDLGFRFLSADSQLEEDHNFSGNSAPKKANRAFITNRSNPSLPTLLVDPNDGSIISEYAGAVEIFNNCDQTRHKSLS